MYVIFIAFIVLELTIDIYIYYILSKFQPRFIGRILMMPKGHINSQSEVGRQMTYAIIKKVGTLSCAKNLAITFTTTKIDNRPSK